MDNINEKLKSELDKIFEHLKNELSSIRGSRPTPALVEDILVEYYGQKVPIKQLGSISVIPPREISISVWDSNSAAPIEKAVSEKLSISVARDGNTLHCNLPSLTQERRDELAKLIKSKAEEARIKSRTERDEIKKEIAQNEKSGKLTEDEKFKVMEDLQKKIDDFNKKVDEIVEKKLSDING